jgi:hypothetical protein
MTPRERRNTPAPLCVTPQGAALAAWQSQFRGALAGLPIARSDFTFLSASLFCVARRRP